MSNSMIQFGEGSDFTRQDFIGYIQDISATYGLYSNIVSYFSQSIPESDRNRDYIIAGYDPNLRDLPLPEDMNPEEIIRHIQRSDKFFYPHIWAYDLSNCKNIMGVTYHLDEYCRQADFIKRIFAEYDAPIPEVLRVSEITQLIDAWSLLNSSDSTSSLKAKVRKELDEFFKREKDPGKQEWLKYFRSDRFPDGKGSFAKAQGFFKRNEQEVSKEQLMEFNGSIRILGMQEHEYRLFRELISKEHPDVTYSVGKKEVVDHGITNIPGDENSPFGRSVSGEEYAVIRKQRFAEEGWPALADLKMSYWEYRDIYYKAADEPLIASVYNKILLEYAKCDSITDLMSRGAMHLQQIPADDFMNFVSLAKHIHMPFYIDTDGIYSIPSLEHVNVIYNEVDAEKMGSVINRMINSKVNDSRIIDPCMSLQDRIAGTQAESRRLPRKPIIPSRD